MPLIIPPGLVNVSWSIPLSITTCKNSTPSFKNHTSFRKNADRKPPLFFFNFGVNYGRQKHKINRNKSIGTRNRRLFSIYQIISLVENLV